MSDQPKDEPKDEPTGKPRSIFCPKCSGYMLERNFLAANNAIFTRADVRVPLTFTHTSAAKALVCDHCGYAEIYAAHPEKLRELWRRRLIRKLCLCRSYVDKLVPNG